MAVNKTLAALQKVVLALAPLDPESRRQVIEAVHSLLPIGQGRQDMDDQPEPAPKRRHR